MHTSRIALALLICWVLALPLAAQTTTGGTITGTVVDPQGAVVPQATVTATDVDRNTSVSAATDNAGIFVFQQLLPARYALSVEKSGFKKFIRRDLILNINDRLALGNITLQIGTTQETVEVVAQGMPLQTESAARAPSIVGEQLQNIEINGRSPLSLMRTLPGVVFDMDTSRAKNRMENIWINGARMNSLNATLNGTSVTGTGDNTKLMATVSPDSLQEFTVLQSNYQAQYGKAAGGTIMQVTKSGTKDFHGSAYWYHRDKGLNANSWTNNRDRRPKADYNYNYLGYTIGGPVYIPGKLNTKKDKLFFFWSEEYQRQLIPEGRRSITVPTALERTGDFSQSVTKNTAYGGTPDAQYIRDPLSPDRVCSASHLNGCFGFNPSNPTDTSNIGKIPSSRLYAPGIALLNLFPLPNVTGQKGYNYISQVSSQNPRHEQLVRIDSYLSSKWRLFGSFTNLPQDVETGVYGPQGYELTPNYPFPSGGAAQYKHPGYSLAVNLTTTISPTAVNEVTYGQSHHNVTVLPSILTDVTRAGTGLTGAKAFPTFYQPYADWIPLFALGGNKISSPVTMATSGQFSPFSTYNTTMEFADNFSKVWKNHLIKTGAYVQRNRKNQSAFVNSGGRYDFGDSSSNPLDTGFGFANTAAGVYTSFQQASNYLMGEYRYTNLEMYVQDTWKVSRRLTLDLGVRAYYIQPQYDQALQTSTFSTTKYDPTQGVQLFWPCYDASGGKIGVNRRDCNASAPGAITTAQLFVGRIVPSSGNLSDGILPAGVGINKYLMRVPPLLWAPRVGFAVDVTGRGNLVFRAGAGAFYDRYQGNEIFNTITNPPSIFTPTVVNGLVQNLSLSGALLAPSDLTVMSYAGKVPRIYNYSAGIQAKLPFATNLDVSYVGSLGRQLLYNTNINGAPYGTAFKAENQDPTKWGFGVTPTPGPGGLFDGSKAYDSNFVRPYFGYGNITLQGFGATSNYNSLQATVDRRLAKGLFLGVAYTWSKCLTTASNDGSGGRIDGLTRLANYGPCDYDVHQNLAVNYVYRLPGVSGHGGLDNKFTRALLNGWQVSGITIFRNGTPTTPGYSISACTTPTSCQSVGSVNLTGSGAYGARVKLVGNPLAGTSDDPYNRLNAAAFAPPTRPSIGLESPVNYIKGPGINNWDMSLQKNFSVTERAHLEFRVDAFNVFNHTQFSGLNSTINFTCNGTIADNCAKGWTVANPAYDSKGKLATNGFGTISGVRSPRVLQLVTRFVF